MLRKGKQGIITALFIVCASPAYAITNASYDINKSITEFVQKNVKLKPGESLKVNMGVWRNHVKIPPCSHGFKVNFLNNAEQSNTVEVRCANLPRWHIYLPVDIQIFTNVVVARTLIAAGQTITENDVMLSQRNKNSLYNGFFSHISEVCNNIASQFIQPNMEVTKKNINSKMLINRNQTILVLSKQDDVVISMEGIALTDGYLDKPIKVKNKSSGKIIDAIVVGVNKAEISGN